MRSELGINGLVIPEEYGGWGLGAIEQCLAIEELSRGCLGISLGFAYTGLGILPILKGATHEQKLKWLPPIADGKFGVSFCLSEPGAGSDVPGMSTRAEKKGTNGSSMVQNNGSPVLPMHRHSLYSLILTAIAELAEYLVSMFQEMQKVVSLVRKKTNWESVLLPLTKLFLKIVKFLKRT